MADILTLATAGLKPGQLEDIEHTQYPRVDYIELQRLLNTDILDYTVYDHTNAGNFLRYLETQAHSDLYLTLLGLLKRRSHRLVFAMSERTGIPFSALNRLLPQRKKFVTMFTCWSERQEKFITSFNLFRAMDAIAVHCQSMKQHLVKLGAATEHVHVLPYSIDHRFFSPIPDISAEKNLIMSIGEVRSRDYGSLFQAVAGLPVNLRVAASGSWYAREKNNSLKIQPPPNTKMMGHIPRIELRNLYTRSQFVVIPVYDTVYSAGVTGVLEANCMGRPVIAFHSQGLADFIIEGETGMLVPAGDVAGMRDAIQYLLGHPEEAKRMGRNARQRIEEELNFDLYVSRIAQFLQAYL